MVEAGANMACYPLGTTSEGPGPRVGHASLLVGNAFIVYGGDTKMEDSDVLDETLYLLNTCKSARLQIGNMLKSYQLRDNGQELSQQDRDRPEDMGTR